MTTSVKDDPKSVLSMLNAMDEYLMQRQSGRTRRAAQTASATERLPATKKVKRIRKKIAPGKIMATKRSPRARFGARVLLVKNDRYIKGRSLDISRTGIFVAASAKIFNDQELVRVHIRPDGMNRTYKTIARVVRYTNEFGCPAGYGLQFVLPTKKLVYK